MFSDVFLAMTAGEITNNPCKKTAYMACHFSAWNQGLSNQPATLPPGSIILLDDSMELQDHDPVLITQQLNTLTEQFQPAAVLMDFQREPTDQVMHFLDCCIGRLPCPVAVPIAYADPYDCPVFLAPLPFDILLKDYLAPWLERGVYLELALDGITVTVEENGSSMQSLPAGFSEDLPLQEANLYCHYDVETTVTQAIFTLCRTGQDVASLLQDATAMGIRGAVGLYQELG